MHSYLALKLQGVMQAWGGHTYEDLRHSELIPTRSGILGLLGACLGIDRGDSEGMERLASSLAIAVRIDKQRSSNQPLQRITDFHTVMDARKVDGKSRQFPVVSRREYLCDASYTVLLEFRQDSLIGVDEIEAAIRRPVYTPFLGRRSCPLTRPLYEDRIEARDMTAAFSMIEPLAGTIYSELRPQGTSTPYQLRDTPLYGRTRQFARREVYLYQQPEAGELHDTQ